MMLMVEFYKSLHRPRPTNHLDTWVTSRDIRVSLFVLLRENLTLRGVLDGKFYIFVLGKGSKERVVPVGSYACEAVQGAEYTGAPEDGVVCDAVTCYANSWKCLAPVPFEGVSGPKASSATR